MNDETVEAPSSGPAVAEDDFEAITCALTPELIQRIIRIARMAGVTPEEVVHVAIARFLESVKVTDANG